MTAPQDHPRDTCECGDYRQQHHNNGPCVFNGSHHGNGDGHFGAGRCEKFRLHLRFSDGEQAVAKSEQPK